MNTSDMTDAELIRRRMVRDLCQRFGDKEFVVERRYANGRSEWVESIDTYDGDTTWTSDPRMARIFRGAEWVRVWARPGHYLLVPESRPTEGQP